MANMDNGIFRSLFRNWTDIPIGGAIINSRPLLPYIALGANNIPAEILKCDKAFVSHQFTSQKTPQWDTILFPTA